LYNLNLHDFGDDYSYHITPINFLMLKKALTTAGFEVEKITTNKFIKPKISLIFHTLYPFLKPRNRAILLGDILIIKARKRFQAESTAKGTI